jgi:hypothetical protein
MPRERCVEPLPTFPTDALIGRVGNQQFYVGQRTIITIEQTGTLSLRMNDGDYDLWDNDGTLQVGIFILS